MKYICHATYINQIAANLGESDLLTFESEGIPSSDFIYGKCIEFMEEAFQDEFSNIMWDIAEHNTYEDITSNVDGLYETASIEFRKLIIGSYFKVIIRNYADEVVFQTNLLVDENKLVELMFENADNNRGFHEVQLMDISCDYIIYNGEWQYALSCGNRCFSDVSDWPKPKVLSDGDIVWVDGECDFVPMMWYGGEAFVFELFNNDGIFNEHWLNPAQYCDYDSYFLWEGGYKEPDFSDILKRCPFNISKYDMYDSGGAKQAYYDFRQFFVEIYNKYHTERIQ